MHRRAFADDPGDSPAAALYERHAALIFAYLRLHVASPEDAEDLLLEVFLAALQWKPIYSLSPGEQLAWLRQVARNKLADHYCAAARRPMTSLGSVPALISALGAFAMTAGISSLAPICNAA